ncbi:hypothetical protein AGMMS49983_13760 [Clostridia bacterium]|nr:hypothetical protein AGMMS49983_13760 [Clostridia bacterium]
MNNSKEEFINILQDLALCKISPDEWRLWWSENETFVAGFLKRGEYLRIKPRSQDLVWLPILTSQKGAVKYLSDNNIPFSQSDDYLKNHLNELEYFINFSEEGAEKRFNILRKEIPEIFHRYPKFSDSLKNCCSESYTVKAGIPFKEMDVFLKSRKIELPQDIIELFQVVSEISLDGIHISLNTLYTIDIEDKSYCVLGEFCKESDGDLLLLDLSESTAKSTIYYYAHEQNEVKWLRNDIDDLMEKEFVNYLKS